MPNWRWSSVRRVANRENSSAPDARQGSVNRHGVGDEESHTVWISSSGASNIVSVPGRVPPTVRTKGRFPVYKAVCVLVAGGGQ